MLRPTTPGIRQKPFALCLGLVLVVLAAYANHFQNEFHFDDLHSITQNPAIAELGNLPRFFTDASLFSIMPSGRTWRPLVSTSLAIDYWLGGGLKPFYFHLSTFFWFLVQLVLMFFLFRRIMDAARPHPSNIWTAWFATALYGLHPANAETVNYIIQRGDLYDTLGVVAGLLMFIAWPSRRKYGLYLLPPVAAYFSKAPALIFPFILLAYVYLFERTGRLRATWPAFAVTAAAAVLTAVMTPSTYNPGAASASLYRLTQPWVALHYFKSFFLPTELSADTDWTYVEPFGPRALAGCLFVAALLASAFYASRRRETRPVCFGILWFFLALLPTSLLPLAEVTNDHRMFFPFVGLALAVVWSLRLVLLRQPAWLRAALAAAVPVLAIAAAGTWERNRVWRTDQSLWRDVTIKSPKNGRGWMNYGNIFLSRGDVATALPYLKLAAQYSKGEEQGLNQTLEQNLRMALGDETARRYLGERAKLEKSIQEMTPAATNPGALPNPAAVPGAPANPAANPGAPANPAATPGAPTNPATATGAPANPAAIHGVQTNPAANPGAPANPAATPGAPTNPATATPEALLNLSAEYFKNGKYPECLDAAQKALKLRPDFPEAYNNMAAAYLSMSRWDDGIQAARKALALKPGYEDAKNNLDWALKHKPQARSGGR